MSRLSSDSKRQVHHCRACGAAIFILLRTDRRYCTDACRKWWQRHPGGKRVYAGRGVVRLPERPGWGRPKTLAEAVTLLAETRAYATKLQAAAEALSHELTQKEAARAELQDELNRERAKAAQGHDALLEAQERAQAAEQRATGQEKEVAGLKAELQRIREEAAASREAARTANEPPDADRPISDEQNRTRTSRWDRDEQDRHDTVGLLGSMFRRRRQAGGDSTPTSIPQPAPTAELRLQVASLTEELAQARRYRREERSELLDEIDSHKGELRRLGYRLQHAEEAREAWIREKQAFTSSSNEQHAQWASESEHLRRALADREREWDALNATLQTLSEKHRVERDARVKLESRVAEQGELGESMASLRSELVQHAATNNLLKEQCSQWQSKAERVSGANQTTTELAARLAAELTNRNRETVEQREQIASLTQDIEQLRAANTELSRSRDEYKQHAEHAHELLKMHEKQKTQTINRVLERVSEESKAVLGPAERALSIERERRQAVEAMNDELRRELSRAEQAALGKDSGSAPVWTVAQRDSVLLRELVTLRKHRDGIGCPLHRGGASSAFSSTRTASGTCARSGRIGFLRSSGSWRQNQCIDGLAAPLRRTRYCLGIPE